MAEKDKPVGPMLPEYLQRHGWRASDIQAFAKAHRLTPAVAMVVIYNAGYHELLADKAVRKMKGNK